MLKNRENLLQLVKTKDENKAGIHLPPLQESEAILLSVLDLLFVFLSFGEFLKVEY